MAAHNDLGKIGEQIAVDFLLESGFKILERNWILRKAEVDIIARKDGILAVIEVKTRTGRTFGLPQDFVNRKKIRMLTDAVDSFVAERSLDVEVRFDIVAICFENGHYSIEHLEDAFLHF